ncbi:MAG: 50S ribosomal protein L1 [Candidatus Omnitrophica bacterium]|nr:50S ribosomal protein L1 [Candidatus Omnitrophota bacterium]MCM8831512.1 50S ribosomal protein L1 [Candidatus Omnitrophota bacterium]
MKRRSKRYKEALKLVEKNKTYSIEEAIEILKKMPKTKFDETVEVSCKLGVDTQKTDQVVRGSVTLPAGVGKTIRVLVFCDPEKEKEAKEAGADIIGTQEMIEEIAKTGKINFDYCISTPAMMKFVSKLGKILGPRGLMPSPKTGTVTDNIAYAIKEAKRGKVDFRMDKFGTVAVGIGKISFSKDALVENLKAFIEALINAKPQSTKGDYIKSIFISTTMSPSLKIAL